MTRVAYTLHHLAAGDFGLMIDGGPVGTVIQWHSACGMVCGWRAELLHDVRPLPAPFEHDTHEFRTLDAVAAWLGGPIVIRG